MIRLWNKEFRKRNISVLLCVGLFAGCLSGCGGEYAGVTEKDAVSGGAVSGSAVSGGAISGSAISEKDTDAKAVSGPAIRKEKDMRSHPYCSDTNLYYEEEGAIIQARLDGTHKTRILEDREDVSIYVHYVDEDWLYYEVWEEEEEEDEDMLYRAPIRKDAAGYDVVNISDAEKLFTEDIMFPADYMDSHYFFYSLDGEIVKYDLQKRRKIIKEVDTYCDDIQVFRINDRYIMGTESYDLFAQGINDEEWTKVYAAKYDLSDEEGMVQGEQAVFFVDDVKGDQYACKIQKYDGEKITDFVGWKQLTNAVSKAVHADKLDVCGRGPLFYQGGRLYIQFEAGWEEKGVYHMEYVILSQGEDDSSLRYERELTECMKSHVENRVGKWSIAYYKKADDVIIDHMIENDANCIAMVDGMAYLSLFDYKKDKGRLGCFDLNTGKFQWVGREDALFYQIGYEYSISYFDGVFEKGFEENEFTGSDNYWPTKDKHADGEFVED